MKLALTQAILGALITLSAVLDALFGLPSQFRSGNMVIEVNWSPAFGARQLLFSLIVLLLGLAMLGCGIAQMRRARRDQPPVSPNH